MPCANNNKAMDCFRVANVRAEGACQACGCGDNTIGHWTRWCIIPLMVVWIILQPSETLHCVADIATTSVTSNAICTLTLAAFRRLLRQEGAFYHQAPNEAKSIGWWIDTLLAAVAQDAPQELAVPFFRAISCIPRCKVNTDSVVLHRVLPVDIETMHLPPIVCSLQDAGNPGDRVAILPTNSTFCAILQEMQRNPPEFEQNISLQMFHCTCGEYHVQVALTTQCAAGDILVPGLFGEPKIFVQFDGSAHHDHEVGGAGAGLLEISAQGLQLLDWGCLALPSCKDNIVAEVMGADLALRLYERCVKTCQSYQLSPLLLDRIQASSHWSVISSSRVDLEGLTLPLLLINSTKEEVAWRPCPQRSIDQEKPTLSLTTWPGKAVHIFCTS